ncbi:MAG: pyruvate kinase [Spirochaetia bacterium]|nr:pyruvate kinase [Spirochaetia bacterium]
MRKTKIICTLGPASDREGILEKLIDNGMNCARFNFSHGTHEEHKVRMDRLRDICRSKNIDIPLLLDTKGPEIRLKNFVSGSAVLEKGKTFILTPDDILGNDSISGVSYPDLAKYLTPGTQILIDDGKLALAVDKISGRNVVCTVVTGGKVSNHKSLNIPGCVIPMPYLRQVDKDDILFGISQNVDFIAASFVRTGDDVKQLRDFLVRNGGENIQIISKIENRQGVDNMDDIIALSDGVMVARGDMGVEIPFKYLPAIQKKMIDRCYKAGKHVVTATQMLESMTSCPRPTRAEVSDVANAIYDGTTAIMLSGESASGQYPAEAVKVMSEVAEAAEDTIDYADMFRNNRPDPDGDFTHAVSLAACDAANYLKAKAIIVITRSGRTAMDVSNCRPGCPVIAVTLSQKGKRQLDLAWGITAVQAEEQITTETLFSHGIKKALETGIVKSGDMVVLIAGSSQVKGKFSDMMKIDIAE